MIYEFKMALLLIKTSNDKLSEDKWLYLKTRITKHLKTNAFLNNEEKYFKSWYELCF
jgi:hypothetical protein